MRVLHNPSRCRTAISLWMVLRSQSTLKDKLRALQMRAGEIRPLRPPPADAVYARSHRPLSRCLLQPLPLPTRHEHPERGTADALSSAAAGHRVLARSEQKQHEREGERKGRGKGGGGSEDKGAQARKPPSAALCSHTPLCFALQLPLCISAFFTSGIFYGWASLYTLFLDAGIYSDLCTQTDGVASEPDAGGICSAQKERLTLIYTVASSVNLLSQLPWGLVLDFLGPRVCNMFSTSLVISGFILLSLSARGVCDGFMLAMCLIGGAGPGAQISLFHLSELFPPLQKSTVLSVVTGAFQLGFVVFMLFGLAYTHLHISVATLAIIYCIPLAFLLLLGGVLWPDAPCIPPDDFDPLSFTSRRPSAPHIDVVEPGSGKHDNVVHYSHFGERNKREIEARGIFVEGETRSTRQVRISSPSPSLALLGEEQPLMRNNREADEEEASIEGIRSPTPPQAPPQQPQDYGSMPDPHSSPSIHFVHRELHALKSSRSNPNLKGLTASNPFLAQLMSPSFVLCLVWMSLCLFWANMYIGTVVEQIFVKANGDVAATRAYTNYFTLALPSGVLGIGLFGTLTDRAGFSASIACTSVFGMVFAAGACWGSLGEQIVTFVAYSFFRSFLFSCMFAYLAHEFGYRHFGLLSGIILAVGGALGTLQYQLARALVVEPGQGEGEQLEGSDDDGGLGPGALASFHRLNQIQFWCLASSLFFAVYVAAKQRIRARKIEAQIQAHTRTLRSIY